MTLTYGSFAAALVLACVATPSGAADYKLENLTFHVEENEWRGPLTGYAYMWRQTDPNVSHDDDYQWEHLNSYIQPSLVNDGLLQGVAYQFNFATPYADRAQYGGIGFEMFAPAFTPDRGWKIDKVTMTFEGAIPPGMPVWWDSTSEAVMNGNNYVVTREAVPGRNWVFGALPDGTVPISVEFGIPMTPPVYREGFSLTIDRFSVVATISPVPEVGTLAQSVVGLCALISVIALRRRQ